MTDQEKWQAVARRDQDCDGLFYYGVKSTGVFCRPGCKSRLPRRENVAFFASAEDARVAGYRPCKRCRPDLQDYQPVLEVVQKLKDFIDTWYLEQERIEQEARKLGVTPGHLGRIFKKEYGVTPGEYADSLRARAAKAMLEDSGTPILEVAYTLGFESLSAFYAFFAKHTGASPGEYRRGSSLPVPPSSGGCHVYDTALGAVAIAADDTGVTSLRIGAPPGMPGNMSTSPLADQAARQLEEYLDGRRRQFTVPLHPQGTPFQQAVWAKLLDIPFGQTSSYKEVALVLGKPGASRAVGMANNKNPIWILIPCHRVVGAGGELVGYAGGLELKRRLLELERE